MLSKLLKKNSFINLVDNSIVYLIANFINLGVLFSLAFLLDLKAIGKYYLFISIVGTISIVLASAFPNLILSSHSIARARRLSRTAARVSLAAGATLCAMLWLLDITTLFGWAVVAASATAATSSQQALMLRSENASALTKKILFSSIFGATLRLLTALEFRTAESVITASVAVSILTSIIFRTIYPPNFDRKKILLHHQSRVLRRLQRSIQFFFNQKKIFGSHVLQQALNSAGISVSVLVFSLCFDEVTTGLLATAMIITGLPSLALQKIIGDRVLIHLSSPSFSASNLEIETFRLTKNIFYLALITYSLLLISVIIYFYIFSKPDYMQSITFIVPLLFWQIMAFINTPAIKSLFLREKYDVVNYLNAYTAVSRIAAVGIGAYVGSPIVSIIIFSTVGVLHNLVLIRFALQNSHTDLA